MRLLILILFGALLTLATGDFILQELDKKGSHASAENDPDLRYQQGYALYTTYCQNCHGKHGDGLGTFSGLTDATQLPDFTQASFSRSREEMRRVIQEGGIAMGLDPMMPRWKTVLSDEEIDTVAFFIQRLNKEGALRPGTRRGYSKSGAIAGDYSQ